MKLLICLILFALAPATQPAAPDAEANALAEKVMKASGSEVWPKVTRIKFNFGGRAQHDWDIRKGTDTVTWDGKTVTFNIGDPGNDPDARAAFQRWTNDTFWLLMPLKLNDGGLKLTLKDDAEISGKRYKVLHLSYLGVGLTPKDQYNLYIDPETHLVRAWDFMPNPDRKSRHTWDGYQNFNGLMISTEHDMGNGRTLKMSDIEVFVE